ncbi:hypothetical protein NC651_024773 [Populus alba x Populus x berolinensis]|nr:hypothetical protein NC651_024773 [Populus alba x Populus x berolinensis]
MVKDGLVSDVFSYNMPIDCFCKANVMNEAAKAFKVMQSLIIDGLCQAQQVDDALVCFSEMVEWGISLNAVTHNILIRYLCVRGDAARSMKPLLDMQKHGKSLDILSAFLVGVSIFCCNLGKADEDGPQTGTGIAGGMPQTGTGIVDGDPAEVVAKALLCFNNKYVSGILILSTHGRIHAVEFIISFTSLHCWVKYLRFWELSLVWPFLGLGLGSFSLLHEKSYHVKRLICSQNILSCFLQIALALIFAKSRIYSSCQEAYRLT